MTAPLVARVVPASSGLPEGGWREEDEPLQFRVPAPSSGLRGVLMGRQANCVSVFPLGFSQRSGFAFVCRSAVPVERGKYTGSEMRLQDEGTP